MSLINSRMTIIGNFIKLTKEVNLKKKNDDMT